MANSHALPKGCWVFALSFVPWISRIQFLVGLLQFVPAGDSRGGWESASLVLLLSVVDQSKALSLEQTPPNPWVKRTGRQETAPLSSHSHTLVNYSIKGLKKVRVSEFGLMVLFLGIH